MRVGQAPPHYDLGAFPIDRSIASTSRSTYSLTHTRFHHPFSERCACRLPLWKQADSIATTSFTVRATCRRLTSPRWPPATQPGSQQDNRTMARLAGWLLLGLLAAALMLLLLDSAEAYMCVRASKCM